jgi:hypothetical protein
MSLYPNNIPRCQYIKTNGTQCGSPALKRNHFCYFHKRWRDTRVTLNANRARRNRAALDMPVLEDAESIQVSLMQVMRLILSQQIDPKTAGLLLYALQTASSNVRHLHFDPVIKTRIVIDPSTVDETCLGEDVWQPEDFVQHIQAQASPSLESSTEDLQEEACVTRNHCKPRWPRPHPARTHRKARRNCFRDTKNDDGRNSPLAGKYLGALKSSHGQVVRFVCNRNL